MTDTKVIDSRLSAEGNQVRRRRECPECKARFNTVELLDLVMPRVIKRNNTKHAFDEKKLRAGIMRAFEKRPLEHETIEALIQKIKQRIVEDKTKEISTESIGSYVLSALKETDEIAYIRFASVYQSFQSVDNFIKIITELSEQTQTT